MRRYTCTIASNQSGKIVYDGFEAMMKGEGDVVAGWMNKLKSAVALITPSGVLAQQHAKEAAPGSANK